jgi:hypothetical protein
MMRTYDVTGHYPRKHDACERVLPVLCTDTENDEIQTAIVGMSQIDWQKSEPPSDSLWKVG